MTLKGYRYLRLRRSLRHPAIRLILAVLLVLDTLRVLSIYSNQTTASHREPPPSNKRIYIASQHWNTGQLLKDRWNEALLTLVQHLGPENVFVTIYESGSYDNTKDALRELDAGLEELQVKRNITLSEVTRKEEVSKQPANHGWVKIPSGQSALRRIPFLASLRNRVLEPLVELAAQGEHFDTILFLNDVLFTPEDVLTLLDTNNGDYAAACSLDFQKWPYYYDTFALRDAHGHETVTQTWPYFRSWASRHAMEQFLPVPVASCWNGMVAMPVAPFLSPTNPLRFRGIDDSLAPSHLEGSECCLIHADNPLSVSKGVFLNPNVRVGYNIAAYDASHSFQVTMSPLKIYTSIWYNRIIRWTSTPLFKEWVVHSLVVKWMKNRPENLEPGEFCLINEMQILYEKGWRHV